MSEFPGLSKAVSESERIALVEDAINAWDDANWLDLIADTASTFNGGIPSSPEIATLTVKQTSSELLKATAVVDFTEIHPTGCSAIGMHHKGHITFVFEISVQLECIEDFSKEGYDVEDDFYPGDYY